MGLPPRCWCRYLHRWRGRSHAHGQEAQAAGLRQQHPHGDFVVPVNVLRVGYEVGACTACHRHCHDQQYPDLARYVQSFGTYPLYAPSVRVPGSLEDVALVSTLR